MSALKAHYALGIFGKPIDQFAFTLVAPLGSNHHYISACACIHKSTFLNGNKVPISTLRDQHTVAMELVNFTFVTR